MLSATVAVPIVTGVNSPTALTVTSVGAVIARPLAGVTLFEAAEAALLPAELVATTVNVYAVPLVRPVTVIGLALPVAVIPPGVEVTV